jgi:hypothetical protein
VLSLVIVSIAKALKRLVVSSRLSTSKYTLSARSLPKVRKLKQANDIWTCATTWGIFIGDVRSRWVAISQLANH